MLEQTMAVLRRWFSSTSGPDTDSAISIDVDRRLNVRCLTNVVTTARPTEEADAKPFPVRVRDISRGGVNLLLREKVDSGTLLSLNFPEVDGQAAYSVLATVLHVSQLPNGEWAAGCAFACELSEDDVKTFVAQRRTPTTDQRKVARFHCVTKAYFHEVREPETVTPPEQGHVVDISPHGIGMLVIRPLEVGTLLSLELPGVRDDSVVSILASVARSGVATEGEWVAGCTFQRELTEKEMKTLV
jgi:hypothetical protein